jgi:hypothetical protein
LKAFISYSHQESAMLDMLHKHLTQLKRDNVITTWTDEEITAGNKVHQAISSSLNSSNLFIALLSHEYIASRYCFETEFQKALEMEQQGKIIIVPIVIEPCDWLSTPFKDFKALPKDGKPISTWENKNTAFLDVVQGIRKLIQFGNITEPGKEAKQATVPMSRNYRVQKDFDSIAKIEFTETTFKEIKDLLKRYMEEIEQLDSIKTRVVVDSKDEFGSLLSNRNKIGAESKLTVRTGIDNPMFGSARANDKQITYLIESSNRPSQKNFQMAWDDYHLYWTENSFYSSSRSNLELDAKSITEYIWSEWLQSVGIL